MFRDLFLKFPDEATATPLLFSSSEVTETHPETEEVTTKTVLTSKFQNMYVIGTIYEQPSAPVVEDYVPVALDGWHVNVRLVEGEDSSEIEQYSVIPGNPRCVWA